MLKKITQIGAAAGLGLLLAACGGSSSPAPSASTPPPTATPPTAPATGSVGIMFTDAPTDEFAEILITVTEVSLLPAGDGGERVELFNSEETFDLLQLRDFTEPFIFVDGVPIGAYEKVRLRISRIELVRTRDENGEIIDSVLARITGNGKLDLNPRGSFEVEGGQTLLVRIDVDARKSILVVAAGRSGQYIFRPVVFVDIDTGELRDRLVRLYGEVDEIADGQFALCELRRVQSNLQDEFSGGLVLPGGCVDILTDEDTGLFDNESGLPITLADLDAGNLATAVGFFTAADPEAERRSLQALVVQRGDRALLTRVSGETATAVDGTGRFLLALPASNGTPADELTVALQSATAVITREGVRIPPADMGVGAELYVEGADATDPAELLASLVVVNEAGDTELLLTGTVQTIDADERSLVLAAETGDRLVCLSDDATITRVRPGEEGVISETVEFADIEAGQQIEAYGLPGVGGCFDATAIVIDETELEEETEE